MEVTDFERKLVAMRDGAIRARKRIVTNGRWKESRDHYYGVIDPVLRKNTPDWKAILASPKAFEIVERIVPVLTDSKPKPSVRPEEERDNDLAELLMRALEREYDNQGMETLIPTVCRDSLITGTGFLHTLVKPGYDTQDDLCTHRVSPWMQYAHPGSTSDRVPAATWTHHRMTQEEIECTFEPEVSERILEFGPGGRARYDEEERDFLEYGDGQTVEPLFYESGTTTQLAAGTGSFEANLHGRGSIDNYDPNDLWDVWEGVIEDGTRSTEDVGDGQMVPIKVYPHGRFVTLVGDHLVRDAANPHPHKMNPVIPVRAYDVGNYFGYGYLARLLDTDDAINKIANQILNQIALTLNSVIVVDDDANIDFESFAPYPGAVVLKRKGSELRFEPPPGLPPYVYQQLAYLERLLNDASGISDISRGNFAGTLDDVSGTAVSKLQEPMYTRVRLILRNLERGMTLWMKQTLTNMIVFRPDEWWQRTLGPYTDPETGFPAPYPWTQWSEADLKNLPDVRMAMGSSLPTDKRERINTSINLYDRGIYGPAGSPTAVEQVLKAADEPEREKIVKEAAAHFAQAQAMQMQQQVMAQAQAQAEAGPQIPGLNKATGEGQSPAEANGLAPEPQEQFQ